MKYVYKPSFKVYKSGAIAFEEGSKEYKKYVSEAIFKYHISPEKVYSFSNYQSVVAGEMVSDRKVKGDPKVIAKEQYINQFHDLRYTRGAKKGEKIFFSEKQIHNAWNIYRKTYPDNKIGFGDFVKNGVYKDFYQDVMNRRNELEDEGKSRADIARILANELFGS